MSATTRSHIWNILSSGISAAVATLMIIITSHTGGVEQSGLLSFSIAIAELFRFSITFGMRSLHATDVRHSYSFVNYFQLRVLTALASVLIIIPLVQFIDFEKRLAIILYFIFVLADASSDVFEGELQRNGKMYRAGQLRFFRFLIGFCAFATVAIVTKNLMYALSACAVASIAVTVFGVFLLRSNFGTIRVKPSAYNIKCLAREGFPLFLSAISAMYLIQAQKYFLSIFGSDSDVAIYTFLITPTYLVALFSGFIFFGPVLTQVAVLFNAGEYKKFSIRVNQQILIILGLSVAIIGAMMLFGLRLLGWVYGVDLSGYLIQFAVMMIAGCVAPISSLLANMLIVMRKQMLYFAGYLGATLVSLATVPPLIANFGIDGAAWSGMIIYPLQTVWFFVCYKKQLNSYKNFNKLDS